MVAILAFAGYKISRHKKDVAAQEHSDDYYTAYPQGVNQQGDSARKEQGMQEASFQRQSLRYPDPDEGGVSANLRREI